MSLISKKASNLAPCTAVSNGFSVSQLRTAVRGRVITPDDSDYDAARALFYGGIDRRPAVIVRAADARDVAPVVSFARETRAGLAGPGGGPSTAGARTSGGG